MYWIIAASSSVERTSGSYEASEGSAEDGSEKVDHARQPGTATPFDGLDVEALKASILRTLVEFSGQESYVAGVSATAEPASDAVQRDRLLLVGRLEVPEKEAPAVVERLSKLEEAPLEIRHRVVSRFVEALDLSKYVRHYDGEPLWRSTSHIAKAHHFRGGADKTVTERGLKIQPPALGDVSIKVERETALETYARRAVNREYLEDRRRKHVNSSVRYLDEWVAFT
ncbi:hypothetical protein FOL47_006023 [Perkinsus chesapeaki]|uniref:Uncharacterized protein n=1 Tax=Perkinsus chesapeaki TaxID=330153 RepID=A0A7J6LVN0_PERCH|nr:hypothetical protein FOL47_006023 [Perkinsus chesapeaki]